MYFFPLLFLALAEIVSARSLTAIEQRRSILNATALANSSYYPPIPVNTNYADFVPDMK
jgi:glucan 1,3-beta-glucosidase